MMERVERLRGRNLFLDAIPFCDKIPIMNGELAAFSEQYLKEIERRGVSLEPEILAWLLKRLRSRWWPRHTETAAKHLVRVVGDHPFFLYGAGTHSLALLAVLKDHPVLEQLVGFLDGRARPGQELEGLPVFPASHALEQQHMIVLSHHEFEDGMRDDLLALGVPETRIHPIYLNRLYGERVLTEILPPLQETETPPRGDRKRIVFVSARPRGVVDGSMVAALSDRFQAVHLRMDRQDAAPENPAFEATFNAQNSMFLCLHLLRLLEPDLIYVQEHYSSGNFLPLALALASPQSRVVGEFYDFLALTFDDPHILATESYWRPADVDLALAAEQWCVQHLHGLITKEDGPVLDRYLQGGQVLKLQPCLDQQHFATVEREPFLLNRLVWAGAIAPSHLSPRMFGDNQLLDVFQQLLQLGFQVTAWSSCRDQATLENLYGDYLALEGPFSMHPALPRETLIQKLAREQDYGLMLGVPKVDTQQGVSHKVTVSGKFHTYMAAGLPIITGSYLEVMADWVRRYDLGVVVDAFHIQSLPQHINPRDYERQARNVRRFRESHHLETVIGELAAFLNRD